MPFERTIYNTYNFVSSASEAILRKLSSTNLHNERTILHDCPFSRTLDMLGNRWRAVLLWKLWHGADRFSRLRQAIPAITEKMLAQELRELEQRGLITRIQEPERSTQVRYALTPLGQSLAPLLQQMFDWGQQHATQPSRLEQLEPALAE